MFKRAAIEKSFRSSLIVLFLSELTGAVGPLIDGVVIAAFLGADGVKEFGIVNPALIVYNVIGSVFAVGSVTLCTRLVGRGKTEDAQGAFSVSLLWILGLSALITVSLLYLSEPVMNLLGLTPEAGQIYKEARNYFIGIHNNDEDRTSNIGIRMVAAMAEEMRYVDVMDMNSLYIVI